MNTLVTVRGYQWHFLQGLLLLYTFCLRAAENDWTVDERTPPGPLHLPLIGHDGRADADGDGGHGDGVNDDGDVQAAWPQCWVPAK